MYQTSFRELMYIPRTICAADKMRWEFRRDFYEAGYCIDRIEIAHNGAAKNGGMYGPQLGLANINGE